MIQGLFQFKTIENNTEDRIDNLDTLVCLGIREVHIILYTKSFTLVPWSYVPLWYTKLDIILFILIIEVAVLY